MTKSSPFAADNRIVIGKVGAPHGVRGEVKIIPLTDFPRRFDDLTKVMVGEDELCITAVKHRHDVLIVGFSGFKTRQEAQSLTGKLLTVKREDAAPLAEGEYYTFDIIGLTVCNEDGSILGRLENVLKTGSNDVYAVRTEGGGELLVPALKTVVREINLPQGKMIIDYSKLVSV